MYVYWIVFIVVIYIYIYVTYTVLVQWGSGAFKAGVSNASNPRLGVGENNECRTGIISIDVLETYLNRCGKVARPRELQPQQQLLARCIWNQSETHYFLAKYHPSNEN